MEISKPSPEAILSEKLFCQSYRFATAIVILVLGHVALLGLTESKDWLEIIEWMEYPKYVTHFTSIANLLAIVGLLTPGYPLLKEWVYSGIVIQILLAGYSHVRVGDVFTLTWFPFAFLGVVLASYMLQPEKRSAGEGNSQPQWPQFSSIRRY